MQDPYGKKVSRMESISLLLGALLMLFKFKGLEGKGATVGGVKDLILSLLADHKLYFSQCYRDLALVSRDGMNIVLNKINQILMEKYLKLQDTCRTQVRPERKDRIQLKERGWIFSLSGVGKRNQG